MEIWLTPILPGWGNHCAPPPFCETEDQAVPGGYKSCFLRYQIQVYANIQINVNLRFWFLEGQYDLTQGGQLSPPLLMNPLVGGGSDRQGQKIKKIVEDKCYTLYFLPLSLTGENIRLGGGAQLPHLGWVILTP